MRSLDLDISSNTRWPRFFCKHSKRDKGLHPDKNLDIFIDNGNRKGIIAEDDASFFFEIRSIKVKERILRGQTYNVLYFTMWQKVDATDRVFEEVLSVVVQLARPDGNSETLNEIFVAPTTIVRAFAEFLSHRNEEETFDVKHCKIRFADVSVSCGDSNQAIHAFKCFQHYNMPLGNYEICDELIRDSDSDSSSCHSDEELSGMETDQVGHVSGGSTSPHLDWICDKNFQRFKRWYKASRGATNANATTEAVN